MRRRLASRALALAGLLALAACSGSAENNLAALDNELMANGVDPALTSALEDQILVDPDLVQQNQPNSARPAEAPVQAQYPDNGEPVRLGASRCGPDFVRGPEWAQRMPREFPVYPGGRVTEAAGVDAGDCHMRVVSFTTADSHGRVLEYYRSHADRAGFSAEQQQRGDARILGGVRGDAAYYLVVTPMERGSDVALIVNRGA
jgi:hypothetical protein